MGEQPEADYTILMGASGPLVVAKALQPALAYDAERDFQPISMYGRLPNIVVVSSKLPIKSLDELIDYVKRKPGVGYGSVGNGSSQHLAGALFEQLAAVKMTHVPYRVTSQLQSDLVAGEVPVSFQLLPNVIGALKGGQVPLAAASEGSTPPSADGLSESRSSLELPSHRDRRGRQSTRLVAAAPFAE